MPPGQFTGRAIQGAVGPRIRELVTAGFGAEIIYSFIIIMCSLMIYFGTKELYKLTEHKGIKYFRLSFLFFAMAYFFRSFIKIILLYFDKQELRLVLPIFGDLTLFIFVYLSVMAIFYLLYSVMWKKWENKTQMICILHLIALIISVIILLSKNPLIYFIINISLFILVGIVFLIAHKNKKKKSNKLYTIYLLLFIFWIFNILDILIPNIFQSLQLFIYLASMGIFLIILYKVLKKTG